MLQVCEVNIESLAPTVRDMLKEYAVPNLYSSTEGSVQDQPMYQEIVTTQTTSFSPACLSCGRPIQAAWERACSLLQLHGSSGEMSSAEIYMQVFAEYRLTALCCRAAVMSHPPTMPVQVLRGWTHRVIS